MRIVPEDVGLRLLFEEPLVELPPAWLEVTEGLEDGEMDGGRREGPPVLVGGKAGEEVAALEEVMVGTLPEAEELKEGTGVGGVTVGLDTEPELSGGRVQTVPFAQQPGTPPTESQ